MHQLIRIENIGFEGEVWKLFDEQLAAALEGTASVVGVCLRPEMSHGTELMDWLERWIRGFQQAGRELVVVAEEPRQQQCLELSHPDLRIRHFTRVSDFLARYPDDDDGHEKASAAESNNQVIPEEAQAPFSQSPQIISDEPEPRQQPHIRIAVDGDVEHAGEYACRGCGLTRMFMKGDRAGECENPECAHPTAGWSLVFELF